jgi:hypothetical protein
LLNRLTVLLADYKPVKAIPVFQSQKAADLFGADCVFLNPDCGFATLADNPDLAERANTLSGMR